MKKTHDVVRHTHSPGPHFRNSFKSQNGRGSHLGGRGSERVEEEWVVMDVINMAVMGEGTRRAKEKLLLAEHRYIVEITPLISGTCKGGLRRNYF